MSALPATTVAHALDAYLAQAATKPFSWPTHNCCHFVAGWVAQATGIDPMRGLPVTPDRRAAWRLIRQLGGSLAGAWTCQLDRAPIRHELASTGDIVLVHLAPDDGAAVGICNGRHVALLTEGEGLAMLPIAQARMAWRLRQPGAGE